MKTSFDDALHVARRMDDIAPFEVMEIQSLARALEARGRDIVHLEIGEPDFPTPQPVIEAARHALDEQPMAYTRALGITPLREAIARFYGTRYGVAVDPESVVVTAGSSGALLLALGVLVDAGEEVLLADPGYPCNRHIVLALGGVPKLLAVGPDTGYQLTALHVAREWRERTRVVLVASPSNPTGTVVGANELGAIATASRDRGGVLLSDEIYHGLTYGLDAPTALACSAEAFVINSFSKYFQMTGWRLGWMVVPASHRRQVETLAQNLYISPSTLAQHAALACFTPETTAIVEARRAELDARRKFLVPGLEALGFHVRVVPQGAFYVYADCSALTDDSFHFARDVLEHAGVAITPGRDFGRNVPERHVRIAYTQPIARLEVALERLGTFLGRQ